MTRVRVRAGVDAGGWFEIPPLSDDAERERFAGAVVDAVARAQDERLDGDAAVAIRRVVMQAASERDESDLLVLAFLPIARPIMATAHVRLMTPEPLQWWRESGFALSPIHTPAMGHGMLATRTIVDRLDEHRISGHQSIFLFADGDLSIAVSTEPTAALVFDRMQEGLAQIVGSLTVEFDDGREFVGERVTALPGDDVDSWDIGTHVIA